MEENHPEEVEHDAVDPHATAETVAMVGAHDAPADGGHEEFNPLALNWELFFWFLTVFVASAFILRRFAWRPILDGLDEREAKIRASIEEAERISQELAEIEDTRQATIGEADQKAKQILEEARRGAQEASRTIQHKAREESQIMLENARREIDSAQAKAASSLRETSVDVAVDLAKKILDDQLDEEKGRVLVDRLIKDL